MDSSINDGPGCLMLRCPDPSCIAAVGQDMINTLASKDDVEKYSRYFLRSFVEDNRKVIRCMKLFSKYDVNISYNSLDVLATTYCQGTFILTHSPFLFCIWIGHWCSIWFISICGSLSQLVRVLFAACKHAYFMSNSMHGVLPLFSFCSRKSLANHLLVPSFPVAIFVISLLCSFFIFCQVLSHVSSLFNFSWSLYVRALIWYAMKELWHLRSLRISFGVLCRQNGVLLLAVIMLWTLLLEVEALMSPAVAHIASAGM